MDYKGLGMGVMFSCLSDDVVVSGCGENEGWIGPPCLHTDKVHGM